MVNVWLVEVGFVVGGTLIAESRVKAGAVIDVLDVILDGGGGLIPVGLVAAVNQLVFERVPNESLVALYIGSCGQTGAASSGPVGACAGPCAVQPGETRFPSWTPCPNQ